MHDLNHAEKKRLTLSIIISLSMYIVFIIVLILAPVPVKKPKEPVYKAVSISLLPLKEKETHKEPIKTEPIKPKQAVEIAQAKTPAIKTVVPKASASSKPVLQNQTRPETKTQGLGIPNFDTPVFSSRENIGEAEFLDFSSQTPSSSPRRESLPPGGKLENELEGSIARVENTSSATQGVVVTSKINKSDVSTATTETSRSLQKIAESSISASSEKAAIVSRSDEVKTQSFQSSIPDLVFDGQPRRILFPAKPVIILPDSLAALIDSDRTVSIQFTVRADGSVPSGLVFFTPSAILPVSVRDFLRSEFSSWRFETGSSDGQAQFQYSIRVK